MLLSPVSFRITGQPSDPKTPPPVRARYAGYIAVRLVAHTDQPFRGGLAAPGDLRRDGPPVDPMVGTVYTSNGDDTVSIIPYPDKARSRDMPGRTLRALIADMTAVKAAPERTICTEVVGADGTEATRAESLYG